MKKAARLIARVEKLERNLRTVAASDAVATVAAELRVIDDNVIAFPESGTVVFNEYRDEPKELTEKREAKLRELRARGFGNVTFIGVTMELPPRGNASSDASAEEHSADPL